MYLSKEKRSLWKTAGFALKKKLGANLDVEIELPRKCRQIFNEFDADGSGRIDIDELREALGKMGVTVSACLRALHPHFLPPITAYSLIPLSPRIPISTTSLQSVL